MDGSLNLAAPLFRFGRKCPDAAALIIDDRTYSYAELSSWAQRVAAWVQSHDLSAPRIGILASRSLPTYAGILGTAWAGGTYVPLNPKQPPGRIASILRRAGLNALIADRAGALHLDAPECRDALPDALVADAESPRAIRWSDLPAATSAAPLAVPPEHPAYIMFTSGTTGIPKGVIVTASNVACFLSHMHRLYSIGPEDRVGQFCETSFDVSVFEMFAAWQGGASLHVVPESRLMAPAGFIRQQALTVWTSVPSTIALMAKMKLLGPGLFPTLRVSFFIGEALPVASARIWQAAAPNGVVDNQYGPTEATVAFTMQRLGEPVVETPGRGTMAIGVPYPGLAAEIVRADGSFVTGSDPGELALSGPQLAAGYLDDPEQTARRFPTLTHPRLGRSRWYLTGDIACRDERGILHCLGRIDNQVKIMGNRVELEDVEAHLRAATGSDAVAVIAWPVIGGAPAGLVAFVCDTSVSVEEIRRRLRERLPVYMLPRQILPVEALPISANGKVDRIALRALVEPGAAA